MEIHVGWFLLAVAAVAFLIVILAYYTDTTRRKIAALETELVRARREKHQELQKLRDLRNEVVQSATQYDSHLEIENYNGKIGEVPRGYDLDPVVMKVYIK